MNSKFDIAQNNSVRPLAYSVDQVADATSLSKAFIRREIREGMLRAKRIGRRVLVLSSDLDEYLQSSRR